MASHQQQRYRVIERLAAGGMAEVYRAESAGLEGFKKKVAIKRVLPHLSEKKRFISMFLDEARLCAHLSHSNCVQVFDVGVGDNAYFIVMEYVDGADLKRVIESIRKSGRGVSVQAACYITAKICEGLSYAHNLKDEKGRSLQIVHRDLSPPNVLITRFGEVKIVDFGLAKASTQLEKSEPGIIKGKFSYLSPEAALGQEVDLRTDIFACGIILWEMLAGRKLFQGETDFETVKQVQRAEIPSISAINPGVDPALEAIIRQSLAQDPASRYQTAEEMCRALTRWLYSQSQAISAFDVAQMVDLAMQERERSKPKGGGVNIIDRLIEEALFEFTSLDDDDPSKSIPGVSPAGIQGAASPDAGFVDIQDWGSELGDIGGAKAARPSQPLAEVGNLAALEDDEPVEPELATPAAEPVQPAPPPPDIPSQPREPQLSRPSTNAPVPATTPEKKGSPAVFIIAAAIVLGAAAAAGAYLSGKLLRQLVCVQKPGFHAGFF